MAALAHMYEVTVPTQVTSKIQMLPPVPMAAPDFVPNGDCQDDRR